MPPTCATFLAEEKTTAILRAPSLSFVQLQRLDMHPCGEFWANCTCMPRGGLAMKIHAGLEGGVMNGLWRDG